MTTAAKMKNQAARFYTVWKRDALAQFCQRLYHDRLKDLFHSHLIHIIGLVMHRHLV
jgi:hypothetical protein